MTQRSTMVRYSGIALAVIAGFALGGCAAESSGPDASGPESGVPETSATTGAPEEDAEAFAAPFQVEATGDGPVGLAASEPLPVASEIDDAASVTARLVTGSGGCFALKEQDRPDLVVFGDGAEFVLSGERPSVTDPAAGEVRVGERAEVTVVAVPASDVEGIPERCANGASEEVLVVVG